MKSFIRKSFVIAVALMGLAGTTQQALADDEAGSALTGSVAPSDDPVSGYYGNTVVCRGAENWCHYWWNADHTYIDFGIHWGARGDKGARPAFRMEEGTWFLAKEGRTVGSMCRMLNPDTEVLLSNCTIGQNGDPLGKHVGIMWVAPERDGSDEVHYMLRGHQ